jgi:hypothetical protein
VLADSFVVNGGSATWAQIDDDVFRAYAEELETTTLRPLVNATLQRALLPVGLDNGTRAANWQAQTAQNPGANVQPLVGIAVRVPPADLTGRSARQIGERVIDELALVLVQEGSAATQALVTNVSVADALRNALDGPVRAAVHAALQTSVALRSVEIDARLADARAVSAGADERSDPWAGLLVGSDTFLDGEARRERVQGVLARRAVASGSVGVLELIEDAAVAQRLAASAPVVDAVSRSAHARYRTFAWGSGVVALVSALVLALVTVGPGRLVWPGAALLLVAVPGFLLALRWRDVSASGAWPAGPLADGAVVSFWRTLTLLTGSLAPVAADAIASVYAVVVALGGILVTLGLVAFLVLAVRPRRRPY